MGEGKQKVHYIGVVEERLAKHIAWKCNGATFATLLRAFDSSHGVADAVAVVGLALLRRFYCGTLRTLRH